MLKDNKTVGIVPARAKRPQPKGGSRKGRPNKTTQQAREAIAAFVDDNAHRLTGWLDEVAAGNDRDKPNPAKAFEMFQSVVEYHIPKLARTELTGKDGDGIKVIETIEFILPR